METLSVERVVWLLVVALAEILRNVEGSVEVVHVGCFSSSFAESHHYYRVKTPLTWEQGVQACTHRLTTHMALYPDVTSPGDNIIFCGNDLLRHSRSVDGSRCSRCVGSTNRLCGGSGTVSLYKLRESTPFSVIIAASNVGLLQIREEEDIPILTTLTTFTGDTWDMDYYYEEDEIWFTHRNNTYRSAYNPVTNKYIYPRTVPSCGHINRSPYFNWVLNRVYYGCDTDRTILELDLSGNVMKTYETKMTADMRDMAIDPYRRLAFFSTWGFKVFSFSLDDGTLKEISQYGKLFVKGKLMTMDHHEQNLYVIGSMDGETDPVLVKVNYDDTKAELVYKGPEIADIWRMDYYNGTFVWATGYVKGSTDVAYKCTLTPKCRKEDIKVIFISNDGKTFSDVKIYHPLKQTPDTNSLCRELNCANSCTRVSLFQARCDCPPNTRLTADNRTCSAECPPLRSTSLDIRCVYRNKLTSCEQKVSPGTVATPSCKPNYKLPSTYHSKHTQITCLAKGEWSGKLLGCQPECGGLPETEVFENKITFGTVTERGEVPWQAGLYMRKLPDGTTSNRWQLQCGGTLISPHIVLTAAHCVKYAINADPLMPEDIKIGLGKMYKNFNTIEPNSNIANVREVLLPPHYAGAATAYIQDLALLDLVRNIRVSEYIIPACVDWDNIYKMTPGETVYVSGWGKTEDGTNSEILLSTELSFLDTNACFDQFTQENKRFVTPDKFCGKSKENPQGESQVMQGDSGGGMTAIKDGRHFVIGVVSTKLIAMDKFAMFTNISNVEHFNWLEQQRYRLENYHRLNSR